MYLARHYHDFFVSIISVEGAAVMYDGTCICRMSGDGPITISELCSCHNLRRAHYSACLCTVPTVTNIVVVVFNTILLLFAVFFVFCGF